MVLSSLNRRRSIRLAVVTSIAAVAGSIFTAPSASAATIASWNLTTTDGGSVSPYLTTTPSGGGSAAAGITAGITRNGTVGYSSASYSYDSNGWQVSSTANNVDVNVTVSSGGPWNVTDLDFSAFRSGTGPSLVDVYAKADGGALTLLTATPLSIGTTTGAGATNFDVSVNETVTSSLDLLFVADPAGVATGGTGTLRLNNTSDTSAAADYFQVVGTQVVSPVPAPGVLSASVLGGGLMTGLMLLGARRHRIA